MHDLAYQNIMVVQYRYNKVIPDLHHQHYECGSWSVDFGEIPQPFRDKPEVIAQRWLCWRRHLRSPCQLTPPRTYTCMCIQFVYMSVFVHVYVYIYIYLRIELCLYKSPDACIPKCTDIRTDRYTYIYICTYIYTHIIFLVLLLVTGFICYFRRECVVSCVPVVSYICVYLVLFAPFHGFGPRVFT